MEVVVTTGAIRRAKLQSNRHHQQTNTQLFTGQMPFLSPNQQCQSTIMSYLNTLYAPQGGNVFIGICLSVY